MATEVELGKPLPELARSARIRYLDGDGRRARPVDEAIAVAAELAIVDVNGRTSSRVLSLAEVAAWLAEVEAFRARVVTARADAAHEAEAEQGRTARRAQLQADLRSVCPHCQEDRRYRGMLFPLVGSSIEGRQLGESTRSWLSATDFAEYVCPTCGSVELFRPGPLTHPAGPQA